MEVPVHQRRVVLTGGIGSGKSTVGEMLRRRGARVIDADLIGHGVLAPGGASFQRVAARWPEAVRAGRIDRSVLAGIVFADRDELDALEALTHPAIRARIAAEVVSATEPVVVVEVSVGADLVGPGWTVVTVDASDEVRMERAVARGLDREQAAARMAAQPDREQWLAAADLVVHNDGDLASLQREVAALWERLTGEDGPGLVGGPGYADEP